MALTVQTTGITLHNLRTRMPFRYGIATLTSLPHLFLRVECEIEGQKQAGVAADSLIPKWFTKDAHSSYQEEIAAMLGVIQAACDFARQIEAGTPFDLWQALYERQMRWASAANIPSLLWNFGVSLVERAVIDAFCRAKETSLAEALHTNSLGIRLGDIHPELTGAIPADLLPSEPLSSIWVRHTVGLGDPLTEVEIPERERLQDGLPQSLEASVQSYGLKYFKVKVCGDREADISRLRLVSDVLWDNAGRDFSITLDGNEQFTSVQQFQEFWNALTQDRTLSPLLDRLLFVEQPLHRQTALSPETRSTLSHWKGRPPIIIDESDSQLNSLRTALDCKPEADQLQIILDCGYRGTSHKNCKGIFKGIANGCYLEHCRRQDPAGGYVLSGEDLINIGPVALLQDLAMMANLGIRHVERNAQHYFTGLSMFPMHVQEQVLLKHADLYRRHRRGYATLDIQNGAVKVDSVIEAPFGVNIRFDPSRFTPVDDWRFSSLEDGQISDTL
jgi:L-alanine-DL-glutamate epimerase-like enolase superfamily enzyme